MSGVIAFFICERGAKISHKNSLVSEPRRECEFSAKKIKATVEISTILTHNLSTARTIQKKEAPLLYITDIS